MDTMREEAHASNSEATAMSTKARLFLVGEYNLFRECLAAMLADAERFTVAAQASTLAEARRRLAGERLAGEQPDLVLFDVGQPRSAALDGIRGFTEAHPDVKVIALGLDEVESEVLPFIEAGASAYVLKEVSVNELTQVIDQVLRGEAACSPKIASSMFSRLADLARDRRRDERLEALNLTPREMEILKLVADGYSNKEIAAQLYLSFHTVKNHVHNILEKLKVQHRSQAVEYAYRKRWLDKQGGERHRF